MAKRDKKCFAYCGDAICDCGLASLTGTFTFRLEPLLSIVEKCRALLNVPKHPETWPVPVEQNDLRALLDVAEGVLGIVSDYDARSPKGKEEKL